MTDIILIDDNQQHLETTGQLFLHLGFVTETLSNPDGAIEFIINHLPKLIILDIMMPGIDGFSLLKNIKADARTAAIPVIIFSGKVFPPDKKKALALGATKFLTKPINTTKLLDEIKPFLQG